jgi:hypothetical protein
VDRRPLSPVRRFGLSPYLTFPLSCAFIAAVRTSSWLGEFRMT